MRDVSEQENQYRIDELRRELHDAIWSEDKGIATTKKISDGYHETTYAYYPGSIKHLNGDTTDNSFSNLAMVCPCCDSLIMLSRFTPKDIWLLKTRGLNNAEIGRLLGISRERVRQLCKKYEAKHEAELTALLETNINDLVRNAEYIENHLIASGRLRRRIDRRTKKKRIIAELNKLKAKEGKP